MGTHTEAENPSESSPGINFFCDGKPEYVFLAAAHVGGIMANSRYRADFIYINLMIQNNAIHASYINNVKEITVLGQYLYLSGRSAAADAGRLPAHFSVGIYQ